METPENIGNYKDKQGMSTSFRIKIDYHLQSSSSFYFLIETNTFEHENQTSGIFYVQIWTWVMTSKVCQGERDAVIILKILVVDKNISNKCLRILLWLSDIDLIVLDDDFQGEIKVSLIF